MPGGASYKSGQVKASVFADLIECLNCFLFEFPAFIGLLFGDVSFISGANVRVYGQR
jgi:hypothetical protein